jgi:hypothetical protein
MIHSAPRLAAAPDVEGALAGPLHHLLDELSAYLPSLLSGLAVLLLMWIAARVVRAIVARVLGLTRLDKALAETRVARILKAFNEQLTPSRGLASLVFFAIMLAAGMAAADVMGLDSVRSTLEAVLGYVPVLASAILVFALGGWIAASTRRAVGAVLREMRSPYAPLLEGLTETGLLIVTVTIAIDVLGADMSLITSNLTVLVSVTVVTLAFLFAWSMRRPAEEIIANYYLRRLVKVGEQVSIGEHSGKVERFVPLGIVIENQRRESVFVPARNVLDGVRQGPASGLSASVPPAPPAGRP